MRRKYDRARALKLADEQTAAEIIPERIGIIKSDLIAKKGRGRDREKEITTEQSLRWRKGKRNGTYSRRWTSRLEQVARFFPRRSVAPWIIRAPHSAWVIFTREGRVDWAKTINGMEYSPDTRFYLISHGKHNIFPRARICSHSDPRWITLFTDAYRY